MAGKDDGNGRKRGGKKRARSARGPNAAKRAAGKKRAARAATGGKKTAGKKKSPAGAKRRKKKPSGSARAGKKATGEGGLDFPVVGVGASAGGLQAFTELLKHLPADTGMAYVFIQHLDPRHKSSLPDILARSTELPVAEAADGARLEPNHVYVMPPNRDVDLFHGVLHLSERPPERRPHMPVDRFFDSLATDCGPGAVGIVLSGTGSDGAAGVRRIKAAGGITIAQDESSARYPGMPHSAASDHVDLILPPADIARELARMGRHPYVAPAPRTLPTERSAGEKALGRIFAALRKAAGVDFSRYKRSTVERRISRRMVVHKIDSLDEYARLVRENAGEAEALFEDMLISVTGFFREPEVFDILREKVFPVVTEAKADAEPVRVWVPGCSTGEEVYSLAICLREHLGEAQRRHPVQVFATDVSDVAIERARTGRYPAGIANDVSAERLARFFVEAEEGYQVASIVRDGCIFARQDVTADPPFSHIDLISCRNLLIYLDAELQKCVVPVLHYALNPKGYLVLGGSESIGGFSELFTAVDAKRRVYVRRDGPSPIPAEFGGRTVALERPARDAGEARRAVRCGELARRADRIISEHYAPPGAIVDARGRIVEFRGRTGRFLEAPPGQADLDLVRMVRPGLVASVRKALREARETGSTATATAKRVGCDGERLDVWVSAVPLGDGPGGHVLVVFETGGPPVPAGGPAGPAEEGQDDRDDEVRQLREELNETRQGLRAVIEEHEAGNEELRAANEEVQSANEELQSTNEELETAKEELQSANEELTTVNEELENRNAELARSADDMNNLMDSVQVPTVVLDAALRIRLWTPAAERVLKVRPADAGRPITELNLPVDLPELSRRVREVVRSLSPHEQTVRAREGGAVYDLSVRPYRTGQNRIEGVVLTLTDVTERCRLQVEAEAGRAFAENVVQTVREPLVVLDADLRVLSANGSFYRTFRTDASRTEGRRLVELGDGQWDVPALRDLLERVLPEKSSFEDFRVEHDFPCVGRRTIMLNARQVVAPGGEPTMILLAMEDVTDE